MKFEIIRKDNRKKWIIGVIAVLAIVSTIFFVSTRANYKVTSRLNLINTTVNYIPSDLDVMAIKIQNASGEYDNANTVPTSGYTLSDKSYCEVNNNKDTSISMEYKDGKVKIGITKQGTKCYLYFDIRKIPASETLLAKNEMVHETFENNGDIVDTGYRYEGANPNNYVTFNNELWRIIGVFNTETASGTTESLVKIIRNESIGNIAWDTNSLNDWSNSSLKILLNEGDYYNRSGKYSTSGLTSNSINMIEGVKWNLGGTPSNYLYVSQYYSVERKSESAIAPLIWNGKVGLIYISDYGYASKCARTVYLSQYGSCSGSNWIYSSNYEWTIIRHEYNNSTKIVYYIDDSGNLGDYYQAGVNNLYAVRPTLYLKSNVSIVDNGNDGSKSKPYDLELS